MDDDDEIKQQAAGLWGVLNCFDDRDSIHVFNKRFLSHIVCLRVCLSGSDGEEEDKKEEEVEDGATAEAILRDYKYNLQVTMMASNRSLKVGQPKK